MEITKEVEKSHQIDGTENIWIFIDSVLEACRGAERGINLMFQCPICGNEASAFISPSNGHKHANCIGCK